MNTAISTPPPTSYGSLTGDTSGITSARAERTLVAFGTGSVYEISQTMHWKHWPSCYDLLKYRLPCFTLFSLDDMTAVDRVQEPRPDLRSASEHLENIRRVFKPAVSDLAVVFGVSRQAVYKWIDDSATPEPANFKRIVELSHTADAFRDAGITRASNLLKMKAFQGRSLLDLLADGRLQSTHVQALIAEARAMDAAYDRSGLARSRAKPSDDWRTELSIPGVPGE
jgi:hypothetical protein